MRHTILRRLQASLLVMILFGLSGPAFAENAQPQRTINLRQAHEMALNHNPNVKNVAELMVQADILIWKAWSILLPNVSTNAELTKVEQETSIAMPDFSALSDPAALLSGNAELPMSNMVIEDEWSRKFGFTVNMTLFNARSIPLVLNAYDNVTQTRYSTKHQKNELLFAVSAAYYRVRMNRSMVSIAEKNLENAKEFMRLSEARLTVGQGTKIDVLRSKTDVMNAEKALKNAADALLLSRKALGYLVGEHQGVLTEEPPELESPGEDTKVLTDKALDDRLDLKSAYLLQTMTRRDRVETYTKWVPTFDVTYNWEWNSAEGFSGKHDTWRLIFGMKWQLLQGGFRIAEIYERSSILRQTENNVEGLNLKIREEVDTALVEMQQARRNITLATQQLDLALETHDLVRKQYENGLASSLDVLNASTAWRNAEMALALEKLNHQLAILSLKRSVGSYSNLLD